MNASKHLDKMRDPTAPPGLEADADAAREATAGDAGPAAQDPAAALQQENERLRDQYLRAVAETRNLKQRFDRERQESLRYAEAEFARDLLLVLDDLDRTIDSAAQSESPAMAEGLRILRENFQKLLKARGVEPIEALGQPFDPERHEALMQQPSDTYPPQTVCQELARGYRMHERILRPARVVVSSGTP